MTEDKKKFLFSISIPACFIIILWVIKIIEIIFQLNFTRFGIYPGKLFGLSGFIFSPLIHSNFEHLITNSIPLLFLGTGILYFYKNSALKLFLIIYFVPGILIWFFGRPAYHIGASGLIYGLVTFLFSSGIFRRDNRSIALALIVTFLYSSLVWGVLPLEEGISWESHLAGSITGIICAFIFRKLDPPKKYDWEDEPDEDKPDKLEISYDKDF